MTKIQNLKLFWSLKMLQRANYNKMESLPYISKIPCTLLQGASIFELEICL